MQLNCLDIGSGAGSLPGWASIDSRVHPSVSTPWNLENYPWPYEDQTFHKARAGHVIARINPAQYGFLHFMNEIHRLLVDGGELYVFTYYGMNARYLADPAACNPCTEGTFYHLDPEHKSQLWLRYQPSPWRIKDMIWDVEGNIEVSLARR